MSEDAIENLGIERTKEYLNRADIVLVMLDAKAGIDSSDELLLRKIEPNTTIFLINKIDLVSADKVRDHILKMYPTADVFELSVLRDSGLEQFNMSLLKKIETLFQLENIQDDVILNNERHQESLLKAKEAILKATVSISEGTEEDCWVIDLKEALVHLGQIVGQDVSEEVLDNIFSRFCVGK